MCFDRLLLAGESQTLEFKSNFDKAAVESLVAFANAQGGTILVGISDAGVVLSVTLDKEPIRYHIHTGAIRLFVDGAVKHD